MQINRFAEESVRRAVVVLALAIWLSASTALAVDGVIEINQARALAGGVTPGDTAGFPVTLSQAGSYRLTSNLDVTGQPSPENVTAIVITVDNVSVDLNGFAILGPTVCSGSPLTCAPTGGGTGIATQGLPTFTAVRNGIVHGMGNAGLNLQGSNDLVNGVQVSDCSSAITLGDGMVTGNLAYKNGSGIICNGVCTVSGNTVTFNANVGIQLNIGLVSGNTVASNAALGLNLSLSHAGYLGNVLDNNNSGGAQVSGGVNLGQNLCNGVLCP